MKICKNIDKQTKEDADKNDAQTDSTEQTIPKVSTNLNVIRLLVTAFIVGLAVLAGIYCFKSCSKDKDNTGKEKMELPFR